MISYQERGIGRLDVSKGRIGGISKGIVFSALIIFFFLLPSILNVLLTTIADAACDCTVCHGSEGPHGANPPTCESCHGNPPVANTIGGPDGLVGYPSPTGAA